MKNNVAGRLHVTLSRWSACPDPESALVGWKSVLGVDGDGGVRFQSAIYHKVSLLVGELDHLRHQLASRGLSVEIYGPSLEKVEQALSPLLINLKCAHVKQHLTPDVYTALGFCSDILANEEDSISEEDFSALVALINELELVLQDSSIPSSLVALIRRHILLAETAIADYPLRGAGSLKDAVKMAIGDLALETERDGALPVVAGTRLRTLWERMNNVADGAIKVDGLVQVGTRVAQFLERISG